MNRNLLWKFFFVVFVTFWALWELYPPTARNLIDEFEYRATARDTNLTAIVQQARTLERTNPDLAFQQLRQSIGTNDITRYFPSISIKTEKDPTLAILHRLQRDAAGKIKLGLDLQGGTSFVVSMDTSRIDTNRLDQFEEREMIISQAIEVLRKRVDKFGVAEPMIQPAGRNRILIQLPGLSEAEKDSAKTQIQKAAFLEFRMVHPESDQLTQQGLTAPGYELLKLKSKRRDGQESFIPLLVKKKPELGLTGSFVSRAFVTPDPISNQPGISLGFNSKGAELFAQITRDNVGRLLGIVLDGELYSAPRINEPIPSGQASITGDFTIKEAYELANVLENPLEAPVKIEEERGVDPSLGKDSIQSGIRAAVIGTIAVALFMLVYYLRCGVVANVALILNIIVLLGVMCSVNTTLTLPGIAGIVLTIGMAVDANVLIFERIREELATGKSMRGALSAGYDKAFGTIFDSNLTTLISSVILIFMGTGPVKGFGVTLTIGITVSMFTALVVTRLIFDWLLQRNMLKSLTMLQLIRPSGIDFLKWAKPAFAASWALIIIGVGYGVFVRGSHVMGVDFAGGDELTFEFAQKIPVDEVRKVCVKFGEPTIQFQKDLAVGKETLRIATTTGKGAEVERALKEQFPNAKFNRIGLATVGAIVGREIQLSAVLAVIISLFGILVYVAFRYEFSFAVGAVIAIMHDVLMTLGWFFLSGRELSAPMVAAILTIIGFSINDTIVIFDRIREDLKLGLPGSFKDIMNQALNQTLSRTIITSGTVFLATMALYLFGGGVINDFAFTFLVGIITGTYSSIYIASALVLWWHKGEKPKASIQVTMDNAATARV